MEIYTVSFFGHRQLDYAADVEEELKKIISDLLQTKKYVEFLVGRNGEFDLLVASVVKSCQRRFSYGNSSLVWVMPYLTADYRQQQKDYDAYYDEVRVSQNAEGAHFKRAIQIRNSEMVDCSDLVIFCVSRNYGGAYRTMKYAKKQNVPYIDLNDPESEERYRDI